MKNKLLFSAALLAGAMPFAASAQAQTAASDTGDEVVVTAQRRSERLVDVPISISVQSAEELDLAGVSGTDELELVTTGLNFVQQGSFVQATVRGVGTTVTGTGADPNVAIYVDGVYQPNMTGALFEFNNIDQIQVLKGPQGTLYGRNATGGAIVVTTKSPDLEDFNASFSASYGSFNERKVQGYMNIPLGEHLAFNIAALGRKNDGYTQNVARGGEDTSTNDTLGIRAKLLFEPDDHFRAVLSGNYINQSDNAAFAYVPTASSSFPATVGAGFGRNYDDKVSLNSAPTSKIRGSSVSLQADWNYDWGTLTSITSYADLIYPFSTDLDGTELNFQSFNAVPQNQNTTTQEFIFTSPDTGRFSWIGGVYVYEDDQLTWAKVFVNGGLAANLYANQETSAYAVYAEGTFDITERLHITAGARYSSEEKHATLNIGPGGPTALNQTHRWDDVTPRLALRYEVDDHSSAYISYTEGFKSGLYNAGSASTTPVEPETVSAYEVGYRYASGGTLFSAAAFFSNNKNIQANAFTPGNIQILLNAAEGEIYGAEANLKYEFNENWSINSGAAYTHAEYKDYPGAVFYSANGAAPCPLAPTVGLCQISRNAAGNEMVRSPQITAFANVNYVRPVSYGEVVASATVSYSDSYFWDPQNTFTEPSATTINARLGWNAPGEVWKLAVYGDNLSDERTTLFARRATVGDFRSFARPRSFGVSIQRDF